MSSQLVLATRLAIDTFFSVYSPLVVNLQLPDGNFGKPYDNYYRLGVISAEGELLRIDLGHGLSLEVAPTGYEFSDDFTTLAITGRNIRIYADDLNRRYEYGPIVFEVDPWYSEVTDARDRGLSSLRDAASAGNATDR